MNQHSAKFKPKAQNYLLTRLVLAGVFFLLSSAINFVLPNRLPILWGVSVHVIGFAIAQVIMAGYDIYTKFERLTITIATDIVSGPYIFGKTTFLLTTIDKPKTLKQDLVSKLFGEIRIRSTDGGKWIYFNQFDFGKDQTEFILERLNCTDKMSV